MNTPPNSILRHAALAILAGCLLCPGPNAGAQGTDAPKPADQGAPAKDERDAPPEAAERDLLRERLSRQLDFLHDRERQLEGALAMLDEGKPLADVREAAAMDRGEITDRFRDPMGEGMRDDRMRRRSEGNRNWRTDRERPPLGPEDIPRLMEFVAQNNPELAKDLHELREKDPEAFRAKLAELAPRLERIMERAKDRPERFQLMLRFREVDRRAHRLARAIADNPPNVADLTLQLRQGVSEGFELRVRLGQLEVRDLHARIEELEKRMQRWAENKDQMIDERVKDMIEGARSGEPPPPPGEGFRDDFPPERGPRRGRPGGPG